MENVNNTEKPSFSISDSTTRSADISLLVFPPVTYPQAVAAIKEMTKVYDYPSNPANNARLGWEAARKYFNKQINNPSLSYSLPAKPRYLFCTKCGHHSQTEAPLKSTNQYCKCGYAAFVIEGGYTDTQLLEAFSAGLEFAIKPTAELGEDVSKNKTEYASAILEIIEKLRDFSILNRFTNLFSKGE